MIVRLARTFTSASASLSLSGRACSSFKNFGSVCCGRQSLPSPFVSFHPPFATQRQVRLFSSSESFERMPKPPYQYLSADAHLLDLSDLSANLQASDDQRQEAFDKSRKFQKAMVEAQIDLEQNKGNIDQWIETLTASLKEAVGSSNKDDTTGRQPRLANLNQRVEDLCRFVAFNHFLQTGKMLPPSACKFSDDLVATDEEYLAGACMGVAQDLSRYAMGRATARDFASVQQARDLVQTILEYLLQFDFRNGFLRRKYDGTKYALKAVETLLYELSVTGASLESSEDTSEPGAKKPRLEPESIQEELEALRLRMVHRDALRESLIKKCRDGQKAAKQAIYALHRKDFAKSLKLIKECEDCITQKLMPIVQEEPPLKNSCYGDVIEEYAEAKLFYAWLLGNDNENTGEADASSTTAAAKGTLLLPHDFSVVPLEPDQYLGGLCDLTGEIGRFAVQRGTARDHEGVQQCLEANSAVLAAIQGLEKPPNRINKKMETLKRSVSKIQRMIYEMSLSQAAGMKMNSEVKDAPAGEGE